jgi:hypothetical protein
MVLVFVWGLEFSWLRWVSQLFIGMVALVLVTVLG